MPFLIIENERSFKLLSRDIDISDLYKGYIYIHGLNIYGFDDACQNYIERELHFVDPELIKLFLNNSINLYNYGNKDVHDFPIWNGNNVHNITFIESSNSDIVVQNFTIPDIIIVGAGTAGCSLAFSLRDSEKRIVVVDPGMNYTDDNVTNVNNFFEVWKNPKYTTLFGISTDLERTTPVSHVYNYGGCSIHNGTVAVKPTRHYLNSLGSLFDENAVQNAEADLFSFINIRTSVPTNFSYSLSETISEALEIPDVPNYNDLDLSCSPSVQLFQTPEGQRELLTKLLPVNNRNFSFIPFFHVDRIIFNGLTAIGIASGDRIFFGKQIILCAGVESSCILEKSGIGQRERLQNIGITVLRENDHVGEHVKNQLGPTMVIRTSNSELLESIDKNNIGTAAMGFLPNIYPGDQSRKYQIFSSLHPFLDAPLSKLFDFKSAFAINICDLNPEAEGSFHIVTKEPYSQPQIKFNYYKNSTDIDNGVVQYKLLHIIYTELQEKYPENSFSLVFPPDEIFSSDQQIEKYLDIGTLIEEHYTSACRMGDVVDENLNVIGINNLKIADCSVLKTPSDGNTQYIAMLVGYICGAMLK